MPFKTVGKIILPLNSGSFFYRKKEKVVASCTFTVCSHLCYSISHQCCVHFYCSIHAHVHAVGLTSSSAGAAVPLTHSTLQQTTSQAISQQYNTYHQQTELELQQLQFSQYQQPTGVYICKSIVHLKAQFQDPKSYNIHICNFMYVMYI